MRYIKFVVVVITFFGFIGFSIKGFGQDIPGLSKIQITLVDNGVGLGTFQSHNQKVVSNENGIFMTYLNYKETPAYQNNRWVLARSTDNGASFHTIYDTIRPSYPPAIETDEHNNLYLASPDNIYFSDPGFFYRFYADENYSVPHITSFDNGFAQKFTMIYDQPRKVFYYVTWDGKFHILNMLGERQYYKDLLEDGPNARSMYPHLHLDKDGVLHYGWTNELNGAYMYRDIHYMASPNGGFNWQKFNKTSLNVPVISDETGPTDQISLPEEYNVFTWLSNMYIKDGKSHFMYLAQFAPYRQHYVRYDLDSGLRDIDITPDFRAQEIFIAGLDGFFSSKSTTDNMPLYCIGNSQGRLVCMASDDNGETWYDYAQSNEIHALYGIGGGRTITNENYIIGSFTDYIVDGQNKDESKIYFFKIKAGLSSANPVDAQLMNGIISITFTDILGQPEYIRFSNDNQLFGEWILFSSEFQAELNFVPNFFQLRSRMGVDSDTFEIDVSITTAIDLNETKKQVDFIAAPAVFSNATAFKLCLENQKETKVSIVNFSGQIIKTVYDSFKFENNLEIELIWDGSDNSGKAVSSGIYFAVLQTDSFTKAIKLLKTE